MSTDDKKQEAMELVSKAYQHHMRGEVDRAIELYTKSLEVHRTPEAYTYRGWAQSFKKDFQAAIADCHRAIDLDPEYGNPYNDIGAYYLELGQFEDTIPWLHMALKAKRYESYCYHTTTWAASTRPRTTWSRRWTTTAAPCWKTPDTPWP